MTQHFKSALFVFTADTDYLIDSIKNNSVGCAITPVEINDFIRAPQSYLRDTSHVVVSGALGDIKAVLRKAMQHDFSVGFLPTEKQPLLTRSFEIPKNTGKAIELSLRQNAQTMDLIFCNDTILLFNATLGRIPLLDAKSDDSKFDLLVQAIKKAKGIKLLKFGFTTAKKQKINTVASGCMIIQQHSGSIGSKLIGKDYSARDGAISIVINSPFSIIEYIKFLFWSITRSGSLNRLPNGIGHIKSAQLLIESETELAVVIDDERATQTPLHCETVPAAVRVNVGPWLEEANKNSLPEKERIRIDNIPNEKEVAKLSQKKIPFFSFASEERFRELFVSLRDDSKSNSSYIVLMLLSTMLATFGLYLDSSSVVIGAMILAPLMAPIVSLAMGILRRDVSLLKNSAQKIAIGISLALSAAIIITLLFPHKPLTDEMQGRLNPTLLDLAVAIISGVAAAYSKSFKEIAQSLAGVAIAVALVPPLAVAGIGLGRGDLFFFLQAFLLFSTNLIGIILAATYTFFVLGYSPAVQGKFGARVVTLTLALITVPLYFSYNQIVEKLTIEKSMEQERYLVNGKYLIVHDAKLSRRGDIEVIFMEILARESLSRDDLNKFKQKIQTHFPRPVVIRTRISYIL